MQDVADDRDVQTIDLPDLCAHRVEVEQRLGRVLVLPVAGVDDVCVGHSCDELWRADLRMADDDHVRVVGAERDRRVLERLALVHRGTGRLDRHRVRRETFGRELERRRRPRGRFVEHIDHEPAFECRQLLHLALEGALECARCREQPLEVVARDVRNRNEVPRRRRRGRPQVLPHDLDLPH